MNRHGRHGSRGSRSDITASRGSRSGGRHGSRLFDQGDLRVLMLHLLVEQPSHGYELIKAVEELTGGAYSPSPGVIYPTLTLLEELGHAKVTEEAGGRKLYVVTDEGKASLEASKPVLDLLLKRISERRPAEALNPGLQRSIENFRYALQLRLTGAMLEPAQSEAMINLLDETTRQIERI